MASESQTQGNRILMMLHASWPNWTPAPELARISLQYCARIRELRDAGWLISNRVERRGRSKHGFYRLGSPPTPSNRELRASQAEKSANSIDPPASLFGDISPDRSYAE
jgi:hypothetical protein